jgi:sugar fermentation stimulation protein A
MSANEVFMGFPQPQHDATFLQRKQRFLASMELADGSNELVYCANSGSMVGALSSGSRALIWDSGDTTRKRRFTWRAIETEGLWVGTDTHLSNRIVEEALKLRLIPSLQEYDTIVREHLVEAGVRVDFLLSGPSGDCFVEVKSSNIVVNGVARYPDSSTPRAVKQLKALAKKTSEGHRTVLLFLVQRSDAHSFSVNELCGAEYLRAYEAALLAGVEVIAIAVSVHREGFGMPTFLTNSSIKNEKTCASMAVDVVAPHQNAAKKRKDCHG